MIWRVVYGWVLNIALPFALLRLWWRGHREPGYRENIAERFGRYAHHTAHKLVWVHAVSVGEVRAAAPLVHALAREYEGHEILLTCMTAAGRAAARQVYGGSVRLAYLPYDLPWTVRAFLEHFRPRLGVLMETELWPNLIAACHRQKIPVVLANARMSQKSARGYARWWPLTRPAFEALAAVCAQSEADAERLRGLGARNVAVTGNLKFDVAPDAGQLAEGRVARTALGGRAVLLLASTREGEEQMLLEALAKDATDALVAVVPRHPQRFEEVAQLLAASGMAPARRSRGESLGRASRAYLGDTMGEMTFYYALADVAIIGGSFRPLGGQNLIEAFAAGAPVVVGPHMFNFTEATQLALEAGAALQRPDAQSAVRAALELLGDAPRRARMAEAGLALCAAHRGATERTLAACRRLLSAQGPR